MAKKTAFCDHSGKKGEIVGSCEAGECIGSEIRILTAAFDEMREDVCFVLTRSLKRRAALTGFCSNRLFAPLFCGV